MPEDTRAELIGEIVRLGARRTAAQGETSAEALAWLGCYEAATPGVQGLGRVTILLSNYSELEPNACLLLPPSCGGRTWEEDGYLAGPPEFVVDVAGHDEGYYLNEKCHDYEQAQVREYVVAIVGQNPRVVWFHHTGRGFEELSVSACGEFRSQVFPGLWLDPVALLQLDTGGVQAALERGLASPKQAEFVQSLRGEA